jgi:hypothetical protein
MTPNTDPLYLQLVRDKDIYPDPEKGWAMPQAARAATPSGLSRFQRLRASMASLSRWRS